MIHPSSPVAEMPQTNSIGQFLPTGFDCGNGSVKLAIGSAETRIPSYVLANPSILELPIAGHVEYLDGDRTDLINQTWLAGDAAYSKSPTGITRVVDSLDSKPAQALQLLLGALSYLPHARYWQLNVAASVHDPDLFGAALEKAIRGVHSVKLNGQLSTVSIRVSKVFAEGVGALAQCRDSVSLASDIVIDFGCGTTAASLFGAKGKLENRKVFPVGVEALITAISQHPETRRQLLKEANPHLIRNAIEAGSMVYGTTGFDFCNVYTECLKTWVKEVLAPVWAFSAPWRESAQCILAIGGGSQLPMMSAALAQKGVAVASDGVWSNARGLRKLAELLK